MPHNKELINGFTVRPGLYELNGATVMPGGVNFTITSTGATACELLLFHRGEDTPYASIPFPKYYQIGHVFSMLVYDLDIREFEYAYRMDGPWNPEKGLLFDKTRFLLDPYAKAVVGQSKWGKKTSSFNSYKARVVRSNYVWGSSKQLGIPMEDLIIYELHVRGFTRDSSSNVRHPGTFAGLKEKIPYLKSLGINAVELMPIFEFDECKGHCRPDGQELLDYWGYNTVCFFAPNTSYSSAVEFNREGRELKGLIHELHANDIEVILDVVFNHTAEGNEKGPCFSFKGLDNNVYYMLTPDGFYYNFSGCGNTLNCNHPIVQQMILDCLRYWTVTYRIDGFRFDLATILGRNEDGSPMSQPPLLKNLAFDPILGKVKLIAEAWDAGGLYQVGSFPSWNRWAEWNGKYRDDMRSFLKGDSSKAAAAALRMTGSHDLYDPQLRGSNASVNFLTCHDGFTLYDLYSYNEKHNLENGWNNTDGDNNNLSWNCGSEGDSEDKDIQSLRLKMLKNAFAALMLSRGTPMFFSGDEFGNSQNGNNNAYCQDNETGWVNWKRKDDFQNYFDFCRYLIHFRRNHAVIRHNCQPCSLGLPAMSTQGSVPWQSVFHSDDHGIGVLYAGAVEESNLDVLRIVDFKLEEELSIQEKPVEKCPCDDAIFTFLNTGWEQLHITLPTLPAGSWHLLVDTSYENSILEEQHILLTNGDYLMQPRSVILCCYEPY